MFAFARIGKFVSRNVLILYYRSFTEQIFRYGLLICGCATSKLRRIYKKQRKLLKLIFLRKKRESVSCFFSESTILCVSYVYTILCVSYDLHILELLKFVFKSVNAKLPTRCLNSLYQRDVKDCLTTRSVSSGLFNKPRLNKASDKNSFAWRGCVLLNYLISNGFFVDPVCGDETSLKLSRDHFKVLLIKKNIFDTLF